MSISQEEMNKVESILDENRRLKRLIERYDEMIKYLKEKVVGEIKKVMGFPVVIEDNPVLTEPAIIFGDFEETYNPKFNLTVSPLFVMNIIKAHFSSCDHDYSNSSEQVLDSLVDMGMPFDDAVKLVDAMYTKEND